MAVKFEGRTFKLRVKPGAEGLQQFKQQARAILGFDIDGFDVNFECQVPSTGEKLKLTGLQSYSAATHCAAITAGERKMQLAATTPTPTTTNSTTPPAPSALGTGGIGLSEDDAVAAASAAGRLRTLVDSLYPEVQNSSPGSSSSLLPSPSSTLLSASAASSSSFPYLSSFSAASPAIAPVSLSQDLKTHASPPATRLASGTSSLPVLAAPAALTPRPPAAARHAGSTVTLTSAARPGTATGAETGVGQSRARNALHLPSVHSSRRASSDMTLGSNFISRDSAYGSSSNARVLEGKALKGSPPPSAATSAVHSVAAVRTSSPWSRCPASHGSSDSSVMSPSASPASSGAPSSTAVYTPAMARASRGAYRAICRLLCKFQ